MSYKISEQDDVSSTVQERRQQTLKATATWPLYSGGSNLAGLKKAKEIKNQKALLLEDSEKTVITDVTNAWSKFQSSKSVLKSIISQVRAAEIANEGITLEYDTGITRTTLEVIQSRSLLLDARISHAKAERDFIVSQFELAKQIGILSIKSIN